MSEYVRGVRAKLGNDLLLLPTVTCLVWDDGGRLLLLRHSGLDLWTTPGGAIEPDESPADAAVRETFEETSLFVQPVTLLGVFGGPEYQITYTNGHRVAVVMTVFECSVLDGQMQPDGEEILEARWFDGAGLAGADIAPWLAPVLATVHRGSPGAFVASAWRPG
jgi:8-oxo-dGTP pyrophosphatase MutT (NUDIX family)